jgi:predicted aspartyl protease
MICTSNVARAANLGLCLALCSLLFVLPATAETIQLEKSGGVYMLPVRINGTLTLPFTLDTGASNVVVTADVVSTLLRAGVIKTTDFIGTGTAVLADGSGAIAESW